MPPDSVATDLLCGSDTHVQVETLAPAMHTQEPGTVIGFSGRIVVRGYGKTRTPGGAR